jgi:tetratricopeptide (TPR) repeat protein
MRALSVLLAAAALMAWQPAMAATKETYAHKMEMGNLLYFNGDVDRSIKAFQRAAELNPKAFEPHLMILQVALQKGGDDSIKLAKTECQEVLKLKPGHKDARMIMGSLLRNEAATLTGDEQKAKLAEAQKEIELAMEAGAPEAMCEQTIAMILLQKGDFPEALARVDKALKKQPTYADAHLIRAVLLFRQIGDQINDPANKPKIEEVLSELDLAIKHKPKNAEAHSTKAQILFATGRHSDAEEAYNKSLADEPRNAQAWAELGNLHLQLMDKATEADKKKHHSNKGRDAFEKAAKLRPNDKNMAYNLAVMLEKQGAVHEAIQEFQRGALLENDFEMKGKILFHVQQLQQAAGMMVNPMSIPGAGTGGGGNNVFTQGLQVPFSSLIKLKDPNKEKASQE